MLTVYYNAVFLFSLLMVIVYILMFHKHFQTEFSVLFTLVPVAALGYKMVAVSTNLESVIFGIKITYIGGCYMPLFIMLLVFSLCHIKISKKLLFALFLLSTTLFLSVLSIGHAPLFYKAIAIEQTEKGLILHKQYGVFHIIFYAYLVLSCLTSFAVMFYAFKYKKDVSHKIIALLVLPYVASVLAFFMGHVSRLNIDFTPAAYAVSQFIYLIIIHKICMYDITETAIDSLLQTGDTGFVSFDFKGNYLGCNETAKKFIPELGELHVDMPLENSHILKENILNWISSFKSDENNDKFLYSRADRTYLVDVNYLYDGKRRCGYQLFLTDDTQNQKYISLLNKYNSNLQEEVAEKTAHIEEMQESLVLGMATMVESRDNSTGGHIKRTSDVVRILLDEMKKDNFPGLTEDFCRNMIKAAPMHDLGKIAVDDEILRKPGRYTPEEFEVMKKHAAEGARIIHQILEGTDDVQFHLIAENVAHYHHERWNGSGYPEGLKGEQIPLEARIMAVADVYDALVSRRVYKEKMSFEQADKIMMEGMGSHFDKRLEPYYAAARPRLEEYYSTQE